MHLLLTALGSYGDVLPMLGLASTARQLGHEVQVVTNPHFEAVARQADVPILPLGTAAQYDELARQPNLWHPLKGPQTVLRATAQYFRPLYDLLDAHYRPGETVIAAHGLDLASRVLQEKRDAPVATVHYAPLAMRSMIDTPRMFGMLTSSGVPRWLKAAQFWAGDRLVIDPLLAPSLDRLRGELGLPRVRRIYAGWNQSPLLVLGMFPPWFAEPQSDWPAATHLLGFGLWDADPAADLPLEVAEFLDEDPGESGRPIVFLPGSANTAAAGFFAVAVDVCHQLGRRGILLSRYAEQIPSDLPREVRSFRYVPLGRLLLRCAAMVHHGGIGTTAQGLAAGLPQLVRPMAYDQLDNACRLEALGVGQRLSVKRFTQASAVGALGRLLDSPSVANACAQWAARCDGPAALRRGCELLAGLRR